MLEPGKITRSGGTSKGSAQKDTLLREASKALIRQGKMWVIASRQAALVVRDHVRGPARHQHPAGRRVRDADREAVAIRLLPARVAVDEHQRVRRDVGVAQVA